MQSRAAAAVLVVAAVAISAALAAGAPFGIDYVADVHRVDSARPQIDALAALDFGRFVHDQSPLGPVSLVLRAPFAALAGAGDQLTRYRLGVFPCLLALALAGAGVALMMRRRGSPLWHCLLAAALFILAPPVHDALVWGHPEELLMAALVVAAAVSAATGHQRAAIALAALAVATKPTAALVLLPVALMTGGRALRNGAAALAIAAALIAPLALADAHAFRSAASRANTTFAAKPMSIWWRTSTRHVAVAVGPREVRSVRRPELARLVRDAIRPAILALALLISLLAARARPLTLERGLTVLALVFLLRCVLDPGDQTYYHVPFVACLAAAEGLRRRPPLLALAAAVLMSRPALRAVNSDLDAINLMYMAWSLPLAGLLGWWSLRGQVAA